MIADSQYEWQQPINHYYNISHIILELYRNYSELIRNYVIRMKYQDLLCIGLKCDSPDIGTFVRN